mgnify:CR=1 FL=1
MLRIGENLNVMVKKIGTAMKDRDPKPIQELAIAEAKAGVDFIDINLGPARKGGGELMDWIVKVVQEVVDTPLYLDTINAEAIEAGQQLCVELDAELALITLDRDGMVLVGPEGGISDGELDRLSAAGAVAVRLRPRTRGRATEPQLADDRLRHGERPLSGRPCSRRPAADQPLTSDAGD